MSTPYNGSPGFDRFVLHPDTHLTAATVPMPPPLDAPCHGPAHPQEVSGC